MNARQAPTMSRTLAIKLVTATQQHFQASAPEEEPEERDAIEEMMHWGFQHILGSGASRGSSGSRFGEALVQAVREVVVEALALEPCHITGMHTPNHFIERSGGLDGYVCEAQVAQALRNFVEGLGEEHGKPRFTPAKSLPRRLHDKECCHRVPTQEEYRKQQRAAHVWADEIPPPELLERGT